MQRIPSNNGKVECNLNITGGLAAHYSWDNLNDATACLNYDIYELDDGEYVECLVYQNSGSNMTVQYHSTASSGVNARTVFMVHRLS